MYITAVKQIAGDYGILAPGESAAVEDATGQELIRMGYATAGRTVPVLAVVEVPVDAPVDAKAVKAK